MKIDDISTWEAFCAVGKYGNFTKAAIALKVTLPMLSKRISRLEENLGVRLFQRSTRVVSLTDEGQALLPKANTLLEDWNALENQFEDKQNLAGTLKITCVPFVAHKLLIPVLEKFSVQHPDIRIELDLSEAIVNIIEANIDIAIRIQTPADTELIYKKLAPNKLVFCASPKYLKSNDAPTNPKDLTEHDLLALEIHKNCQFKNSSLKLKQVIKRPKINCNNGTFLTDLALNGFGILLRSLWDVQEHLQSGALVQVLKKHPLEPFGHVHAVIPTGRFLAPRVRQFLNFIEAEAAIALKEK
jgi:DNA-binding transcriptional LysR family regulator